MIVSVVGKGRNCPTSISDLAYSVGYFVATGGHTLVTGGLGGVMLAAARGAAPHGPVIGILPLQREPDPMWPSGAVVLHTGVPVSIRNVFTASCCDVMLAVDGSHGTMQELAVALDREIPVAQVDTKRWPGVIPIALADVKAWLEEPWW